MIQSSLSLFLAIHTRKATIRQVIFRRHASPRSLHLLDTFILRQSNSRVLLTSVIYIALNYTQMGTCGKAIIKENKVEDGTKDAFCAKLEVQTVSVIPVMERKMPDPSPTLKEQQMSDKSRVPEGSMGAEGRVIKDVHTKREKGVGMDTRCGQTPCIYSTDTRLGQNQFHLFPRV